MVSSYTANKGFEKPANGDYVDTWQIPVNGDWDIADKAFGGTLSVSLTNANVTLTQANCQNVRIALTGALSGNVTIFFPAGVAGFFIVSNATTNAFTVTLSSAGGPGTTINIDQGFTNMIFTDGTNVFYADDPRITINAGTGITVTGTLSPTISLSVPVAVTNGGTGLTGLNANSVVIGNGTSAPLFVAPGASGNVLTSNGTTWTSAAPSGTGGGITSINFATAVGMGLSWTNPNITTSGQTVTLGGTLAMAYGGTGTTGISSGFVKSNGSSLSGGNQVNLNSSDVTGILQPANGGTGTLGTGVQTALGQAISTGTGYFILNNSPTITTPSLTTPSMSNPSMTGTATIAAANFSSTANFNSTPYVAPSSSSGSIYFTSSNYYLTFQQSTQSFGIVTSSTVCTGSPTVFYIYGTPYSTQANFNIISDQRIKKDVTTYTKGLDDLTSLNVVTFKYNGQYGTKDDNVTRVGLIAQDVQKSKLPSLVETYKYVDKTTGEETDIYILNPSELQFTLINAIKELEARVKALEAKNNP
jgi:hypothetical protein